MTARKTPPRRVEEDETWREHAACLGKNPDLFFPEKHCPGNAAEAKKVCAICPVRKECGDYAIAHHIVHGIWAGKNYRQLRGYKRRTKVIVELVGVFDEDEEVTA